MEINSIQKPSTRTQLLKNTIWSALGTAFISLSLFVIEIIIARFLGPKVLGEFSYAIWLISTFWVFMSLGLPHTLTRFIAEFSQYLEEGLQNIFTKWLIIRLLVLSLIGSTLFFILGSVLDSRRSPIYFLFIGLFIMTHGAGRLTINWLSGLQRFDLIAKLRFFMGAIRIIGVVIGVVLDGFWGALFGAIFLPNVFMICAGAFIAIKSKFPILDKSPLSISLLRRLWRYSLFVWFNSITSVFVWEKLEIFFLDRYHGSYEVAMFSVGLSLISLAVKGTDMLIGALVPYFAEKAALHNLKDISFAFTMSLKYIALLIFPISMGFAVLTPQIITLVYGNQFYQAIIPSMILLIFAPSRAINLVSQSVIYGMEKAWFMCLSGLIGASIAVFAAFMLIPEHGAFGAAVSRACAQLLVILITIVYIAVGLRINIPYMIFGKIILLSLCSSLIILQCVNFLNRIGGVVVALFIGSIVYLLGLRTLGVWDQNDRVLANKIIKWLPRPFNISLQFIVNGLIKNK